MKLSLKFHDKMSPALKLITEAVVLLCLTASEVVLALILFPLLGRITVIISLPVIWIVCLYFKFSRGLFFTVFVYIFNSATIVFIYKIGSIFEVLVHGIAYFAGFYLIVRLKKAEKESRKKSLSLQKFIEKDSRAMDELEESENRFRTLFEYSPAGIVLMEPEPDGSWRIIDCNKAYAMMNGYNEEELIGQSVDILHNKEVTPMERIELGKNLDFGKVYSDEYIHVRKDGRLINIEFSLTLVKIYNKTLIIGMDVDITDRIKLARSLKNMNIKLEMQVSERTKELEKTMSELKAMVKEREILLKEIHHRIKNNLQLIQSLLSLQMEKTDDKHIEELLRDSKNRILSMAMIHESMYQSQSLSDLPLLDYVQDLVGSIFDSANTNNNGISYSLDIDDSKLNINQIVPVGLIITEIVTNSLKHAFSGRSEGLISINIHKADSRIFVDICDNGNGFGDNGKNGKNTLGFLLIDSLVLQLKGSCRRFNKNGAGYEISFAPEVAAD